MSSKIDELTSSAAGGGTPTAVARTQTVPALSPGGTSGAPAGSSSEVQITDTATHLAALEQTLRDDPAVDLNRVTQLRTSIEQGRYTINPENITNQLLQLEQALARLPQDSPGSTPEAPEGPSGA